MAAGCAQHVTGVSGECASSSGRFESARFRSGSNNDQQAEGPWAFSRRVEKPPVVCGSPGRRQSRSLHQQSHPTRVVAGVDILRHTSAHKGSPLFRRRAPAPNTVDPRGLLTARQGSEPSGDPSSSTEASRSMELQQTRFAENRPSRLASPSRGRETRTPLQKETCAGESRWVREVGAPPSETAGVAKGFVGVRMPCGKPAACAAHRACLPRCRPAAFPCSPGSGCMTRKRRSCRCAGASARRTVGRRETAAA